MVIPEMVQFWPAISTAALNKERPISAITGAIANGEINCKNIPTSPLNPTASSTSDAEMIAPFNQFQNDCESDFISGIDSERFKYDQLKSTVHFQAKNRFGIHVLNLAWTSRILRIQTSSKSTIVWFPSFDTSENFVVKFETSDEKQSSSILQHVNSLLEIHAPDPI